MPTLPIDHVSAHTPVLFLPLSCTAIPWSSLSLFWSHNTPRTLFQIFPAIIIICNLWKGRALFFSNHIRLAEHAMEVNSSDRAGLLTPQRKSKSTLKHFRHENDIGESIGKLSLFYVLFAVTGIRASAYARLICLALKHWKHSQGVFKYGLRHRELGAFIGVNITAFGRKLTLS